jgi:hypothetical protein
MAAAGSFQPCRSPVLAVSMRKPITSCAYVVGESFILSVIFLYIHRNPVVDHKFSSDFDGLSFLFPTSVMATEKEYPAHLEATSSADVKGEHDSETSFGEWTEADEARIRSRMDWRIVPTVFALYLFCFIDRANVG